ncbi:hypothetical protein NX059_005204 [Plenodomus lindquistii]|nr:hypothetical protein NX059_005204 [Plenodomus lindquistii]
MKYTATPLIALVSIAGAIPRPQFDFPGMGSGAGGGLPGMGSGSGTPSFPGMGSGSGTPSFPGMGSGTGTPSLGSGLGGSSGGGSGMPSLGSGLGGGLGGSSGAGSGMPSLGSGLGSGLGGSSGGSGMPSLGSGLGGGLGGGSGTPSLGSGTGSGTGSDTQASEAPAVSKAPQTGGSAGTIGTNCTPQGAGSSSENGVKGKNCCTDMTVIFARGTGEMGNVGSVSGPPMFKALRSSLGADRVTVQGVDYPASYGGNMNQGGDGGKIMADLVATALSQCPDTKIIVSGYSQGGMVVHNAFKNGLSASKVSGAVLFGDPLKRQPVGDLPANKIKQFCGPSDTICGGGGDGGATGGHISYGSSANAAATFAIQAAGLA